MLILENWKPAKPALRLLGLAVVGSLTNCSSSAVTGPTRPDPHAELSVIWEPYGPYDDEDAALIGTYVVHVRFHEEKLTGVLEFMCDADWRCLDWLRNHATASVTRGETQPSGAFEVDPYDPSDLVSPRPYYLIDNPAMRSFWRKSDPVSVPINDSRDQASWPAMVTVPREVMEHLSAIESTKRGARLGIEDDKVLMDWARQVCLEFKLAIGDSTEH